MNVKIKADGVFCPFEKRYEQLYSLLYEKIGTTSDWMFTERKVGLGYLQWELPGEGWLQLASADPILQEEVRSELQTRKLSLIKKGIVDADNVNQILATPDDSYVYFKKTPNGAWEIKLTAWGYCYPVRINATDLSGLVDPMMEKQDFTLRMIYDGQPVANKNFELNGFGRCTDNDGELVIKKLPVGYELDVKVDGQMHHIVASKGVTLKEIDLTQWCTIEVKATLNGAPYAFGVANVNYGEKQFSLNLDTSGSAQEKIALSQTGESCEVRVGDAFESKPLINGSNLFLLDLKTPEVDVEVNVKALLEGTPCADKVIEISYNGNMYNLSTNNSGEGSIILKQGVGDCKVTCDGKTITKPLTAPTTEFLFEFAHKYKKVLVKATLNGQPYSNAQTIVECNGETYQLVTNALGEAETNVKVGNEGATCTVLCENKDLSKPLVDDVNLFTFNFDATVDTEVVVTIHEKGKPCKDMMATVSYGGNAYTLRTNEEGRASITLPINRQDEQCYVKVLKKTLNKKLEAPQTFFDFEIIESTPWWMYLLGLLGILLFLILTTLTFCFCGGMLFG